MSFDKRLRKFDEKKKDLISWESELEDREKDLKKEKNYFDLEQENGALRMQLKAAEISGVAHQLLYRIKSEYKDSLLEQLKSLYATKLGHVQMMHEKAIILKDIDIAFLEKSNKLQDKIYLAEKLALQQQMTIMQERTALEKAGYHNRIQALESQNHRLNDIQKLQLENVKKQFLKRLFMGEMALNQSEMEKQHLLQKSALNELIMQGKYGQEERQLKLDKKVEQTSRNLEKMQLLKERIENSDSIHMLREYDETVEEVYRNQKYYYESSKKLASFQKDSPEWELWRQASGKDYSDYKWSERERKRTLHKLNNLLEKKSWGYRSEKYFDIDRWEFIDSRTTKDL